tara:strand:+ start:2728 stop:3018 length:291 start_codon:yes stop_codon:yes gene_type:complete
MNWVKLLKDDKPDWDLGGGINSVMDERFWDLNNYQQEQLLDSLRVVRLPPEFGSSIVEMIEWEPYQEASYILYLDNDSPNVVILHVDRKQYWGNKR